MGKVEERVARLFPQPEDHAKAHDRRLIEKIAELFQSTPAYLGQVPLTGLINTTLTMGAPVGPDVTGFAATNWAAPVAGYYRVDIVLLLTSAAAREGAAILRVDGNNFKDMQTWIPAGLAATLCFTHVVQLNAKQQLSVFLVSLAGVTLMEGTFAVTRMEVT